MIVGIVGSRHFTPLGSVREFVMNLPEDTVIVSGGAVGVDLTAEESALEKGFSVIVYKPDWNKYGKRAGAVRNLDIVSNSDRVVAFWDGESRGTKISIDIAKRLGKPLEVFRDF